MGSDGPSSWLQVPASYANRSSPVAANADSESMANRRTVQASAGSSRLHSRVPGRGVKIEMPQSSRASRTAPPGKPDTRVRLGFWRSKSERQPLPSLNCKDVPARASFSGGQVGRSRPHVGALVRDEREHPARVGPNIESRQGPVPGSAQGFAALLPSRLPELHRRVPLGRQRSVIFRRYAIHRPAGVLATLARAGCTRPSRPVCPATPPEPAGAKPPVDAVLVPPDPSSLCPPAPAPRSDGRESAAPQLTQIVLAKAKAGAPARVPQPIRFLTPPLPNSLCKDGLRSSRVAGILRARAFTSLLHSIRARRTPCPPSSKLLPRCSAHETRGTGRTRRAGGTTWPATPERRLSPRCS